MTAVSRPLPEGRSVRATLTRWRSWEALAFPAVLGLAAVAYLVNLTVSGYGNLYYAAAAQAGAQSWASWFFGSLDAGDFITIDKPPLSTMVLGLSVRVFGLSSWSVLAPQALMGIAAVAILYLSVRRTFGVPAAVIAGVVFALTPAAVLMFRYDNPDALLTLLLVGAAASLLRALEDGRWRWLVAAAALVGFAFSTKFLQAYLVLPAFALTWAIAGPGSSRRRAAGLLVAALVVAVTSLWWVVAMELIPAGSRPYIGGSTTDSALELLLGYDGLGRILGQGGGGATAGAGGGGGTGFSGDPGILRLLNAEMGGQTAWFLVASLVGLIAGLVARWRAPRTDPARAAFLLWGGWLVVTALVFSFMSGIIHSYYTVALAPAIGALTGAGLVTAWRARERLAARSALAIAIAASGVTAWLLLERVPAFWPGLGILALGVGLAAAIVVALPPARTHRRLPLAAATAALVVLMAGPAAFAIDTIQTAYRGGDVAAGPQAAGDRFAARTGIPPGGAADGGLPSGGTADDGGVPPDRTADDGGAQPGGTAVDGGAPQVGTTDGSGVASGLTDYLAAERGDATWIVAVTGAEQAATIQLATGMPVMAMGGFSGSDPTPTVDELRAWIADGSLRFVMVGAGGQAGGDGGRAGDRTGTGEVAAWVQDACTLVDLAGVSGLYDCSGAN